MKYLLALLIASGLLCVAVARDSSFPDSRSTGAASIFIAGSGTNSVIEFENTTDVPWRLQSVTATTNQVAVNYTIYRVWNYQRQRQTSVVTTNINNVVETNIYYSVVSNLQTNQVATQATTYPSPDVWLRGDIMRVDFGSETGVVFRAVGSTP